MPRLTISLLGPPRIERDGAAVEVDTRKAVALLAYVALSERPHGRDALAGFLWPDYDAEHARAALRRTLSALRKGIGEEWIEGGRERIVLRREAGVLWIDVDEFHAQLREAAGHGHPATEVCEACLTPLTAAVALFGSDFLSGFALRDSADFDDWQFLQADELRAELGSALERLVRLHCARGELDTALPHARRWLALDPLHEPAHRRLIELYAWSGRRAAALRQYRDCVRLLDRELGVSPLAETTALWEVINDTRTPERPQELAGASTLTQRPAQVARAGRPTPVAYPLVGRETELATVLGAWRGSDARGHLAVLEGEAGIGKTRLAEDFLAAARAEGATVLGARCYEGEAGLAYSPFADALAEPGGGEPLAQLPETVLVEVARLSPLRRDLPPAPPLDSPGARTRFFEALSRAILALTGGERPGILFLDDLHWADAASLDLLTYLARRPRPLFTLVTWRSEQVPVGHVLRRLAADARRAGRGSALALERLSLEAVAELAASAPGLADGSAGELAGVLHAETEGLPFFVTEYLDAMSAGGPAERSLPSGVRDLLRARVADVGEVAAQLLTTAAVMGRPFDFETAHTASGRSEEEAVSGLEELTARGLVRELAGPDGAPPSFDFSHEKLRAQVYEDTSLVRRRLLHGRVADAYAAGTGGRRPRETASSLVAEHYRLAGREADAAEHFARAGHHARGLYANAEALAHFQSALALGHPAVAALHEALGDLQTLGGDYGAALASYEKAAAQADPRTAAAVEHKLAGVHDRRGEWERAESHYEAALGGLASDGERARLLADRSLTAHHGGRDGRARELAHEALGLADAAGDARALAQAHNMLGVLASSERDLKGARTHLERSIALGEQLGDATVHAAALNNLSLALRAGGETEAAIDVAEQALELCARQGDRHREAALHNNLADLHHEIGRSEAAMAHLKEAVTIFADIGEEGVALPEVWKLVEW